MRHFNGHKIRTLTLLSVVVPLGLLTAFRLIGVLPGPPVISETITLETTKWESERPCGIINFWEKAQSFYDSDIEVVESIWIDDYGTGDSSYGGSGFLSLSINTTSFVPFGYISDIRLAFYERYENARINFFEEHQLVRLENLSITDFKDWTREGLIDLAGVNRPNRVSLQAPIHWVLNSPKNQTHQLDIVSEVVYFNGSVFKKVVQPFQFQLIGDNNDSFETADEIHEGFYPRFFLGPGPSGGDPRDYYRINVTRGETFHVTVDRRAWIYPRSPNPVVFFTVHIYDTSRNPVVAAESPWDDFKSVDFVADSSGFWFIEVRNYDGLGFYSLGVNQ